VLSPSASSVALSLSFRACPSSSLQHLIPVPLSGSFHFLVDSIVFFFLPSSSCPLLLCGMRSVRAAGRRSPASSLFFLFPLAVILFAVIQPPPFHPLSPSSETPPPPCTKMLLRPSDFRLYWFLRSLRCSEQPESISPVFPFFFRFWKFRFVTCIQP